MIVNNDERSIDFSQNPSGELDDEVLTSLRDALQGNDNYCKLVFDNNRLNDDAIGILAAILKGSTPIEHLSLSSCQFRDVDFTHIANALCVKKVLRHLDLSKNPEITSAAAADLSRVIRTLPSLRTLLLIGTGLQPKNCSNILAALKQSPSLKVVELPYTVGFKVLDSFRKLLEERNGDELEDSQKKKKKKAAKSEAAPTDSGDGVFCCSRCDTWKATSMPRLVLPPIHASQTAGQKPLSKSCGPSNSLRMMEFRCWADPAVKNAAVHLHVLDKRCHLWEVYQKEKKEKILARRGVDEKNRAVKVRSRYGGHDACPNL
ncbi:hypothetical protein TcG_01052 [Trypanosoma cruzi]|uniref:Leucine-rich repeat protein (LRRP) n=1 Tax=Trypanosoma cruzi TaxID=5693 RepID=A0A2V2VKH7_TRYCR|nr:hypothetical protein BCY84_01088 [Trypanosoma cruzi cruzi]PWU96664.1 hypothetical protein C4B63_18g267 [Trypanosoma cruzi]RNF24241.1 hypothetical protein TcG_01052 [Trypanosoma cruzi]